MALNDWLGTGTLNLPFSATEAMNEHPSCQIIDGVLYIDDTGEDQQVGGIARVEVTINESDPYRTLMFLKALTGGQVRMNVAGEHGAWHNVTGLPFNETIPGGAHHFVGVEFASNTVCAISLAMVQPAS